MPIPFEENCSPIEFFQKLIEDLANEKISAFSIAISYNNGERETLQGVFNEEKDRLIPLIPTLEKLLKIAQNEALSDQNDGYIIKNELYKKYKDNL